MTITPVFRQFRWTVSDLEDFPDNGNRYEIVDGELFINRAPHLDRQDSVGALYSALLSWSLKSEMGKPFFSPGIVFSTEDAVIPDLIWISHDRKSRLIDDAGHLKGSPELVVEVLSKPEKHKKCYYQAKLKLYSAQGVLEYWIVDYEAQAIAIYRREEGVLKQALTLFAADILTSPLLPGFSCAIAGLF